MAESHRIAVCPKCGVTKPATDFPRHSRRPDDRTFWRCKRCKVEAEKKRRRERPELGARRRAQERKYRAERYARGVRQKRQRRQRNYRTKQHRANCAAQKLARRFGKPTTCADCGKSFEPKQIHGHHEDYDKPKEVIWICYKCHGIRHRKYRDDRLLTEGGTEG
jgi:hypothetical protein